MEKKESSTTPSVDIPTQWDKYVPEADVKKKTHDPEQEVWAVGFDIETGGARRTYHSIIGIGIAVVNDKFELVKKARFGMYRGKRRTLFETRCWDEYWTKQAHTLEKMQYAGDPTDSTDEMEHNIIYQFQMFRRDIELVAKIHGIRVEYVSDTNAFDSGCINHLLEKHMPSAVNPIPYSALNNSWGRIWNTTSMMWGLLDDEYVLCNDRGYSKRLRMEYKVPEQAMEHSHLPDEDAYTIAFDFQACRNIRKGVIEGRIGLLDEEEYESIYVTKKKEDTLPVKKKLKQTKLVEGVHYYKINKTEAGNNSSS